MWSEFFPSTFLGIELRPLNFSCRAILLAPELYTLNRWIVWCVNYVSMILWKIMSQRGKIGLSDTKQVISISIYSVIACFFFLSCLSTIGFLLTTKLLLLYTHIPPTHIRFLYPSSSSHSHTVILGKIQYAIVTLGFTAKAEFPLDSGLYPCLMHMTHLWADLKPRPQFSLSWLFIYFPCFSNGEVISPGSSGQKPQRRCWPHFLS